MFRTVWWTLIYLATLGTISIEVEYTDGLRIKLIGWPEKLSKKPKQ